jgi:PIN domain nuclease of toxin-antitoxin system
VRVLLDTATFIYAVQAPERLSRRALRTMDNSGNTLELSSVSISEIAIKATIGKLQLTLDPIRAGIRMLDLSILPFTADHAFRLFDLPQHHYDPFDRLIIAQALSEEIPLISSDRKFSLYEGLQVIW